MAAATLHFAIVEAPHCGIKKNVTSCEHSLVSHLKKLRFSASDALGCGVSCIRVESLEESTVRSKCFRIRSQGGASVVAEKLDQLLEDDDRSVGQFTCVMKFGGSSLASADRMKKVADLIYSFPEEKPVIVLSAMGKTTNKLLLAGGEGCVLWCIHNIRH